jgi:hypothetical protein
MPAKEFDAFTRLDASDVNAYLANKSISNAIINGAFDIWQRGTGTAPTATSGYFSADRWITLFTTAIPTSSLASQQTFSPGAAPIEGYEGTFFLRHTLTTVGSNTICSVGQRIEDVRTLAGQTVTLSFFAKADSNRTHSFRLDQNFGSGGSSQVVAKNTTTFDATTSWQRFSFTFDLPSISGKTIGTNSYLQVRLINELSAGSVFDIWGVQLEPGTVANDFRRNANSLQGELAACERYYQRVTGDLSNFLSGVGYAASTTVGVVPFALKTTFRAGTTSIDYSGIRMTDAVGSPITLTSMSVFNNSGTNIILRPVVASGLTAFRQYILDASGSGSFIAISAEL